MSAAVDRLNPWASLSSASVDGVGWAASSMELDSAGASVLLSTGSVSEESEDNNSESLWREEPDRLALPFPVLSLWVFVLPEPLVPLSVLVLPEPLYVDVPPLPDASVTIH